MIEAAIEGGEQKFNGRNKIIKRFCGPLDGKSGLRMFEFISEAKPPETKFLRSKVFIDGKIQKK
jgi:hypothetical protein